MLISYDSTRLLFCILNTAFLENKQILIDHTNIDHSLVWHCDAWK